jgi:hypothetical protein
MPYSIHLNKAIAVARTMTVRPDQRCFGRLSSASGLQEITPRVAKALRLALEAAPHLQRHVLLARKLSKAGTLGTHSAKGISSTAGMAALEAIPEALRQALEALQQDLLSNPPSAVERAFLEAAAFGTFPEN